MGDDVIDDRGRYYLALILVCLAQWVLGQPAKAGTLPGAGVATLVGRAALAIQLTGLDSLVIIASARSTADAAENS